MQDFGCKGIAFTHDQVGTTVCVNDIFARLPLRRKAMEQTKSRQLQDALALLQRIALQYATVCRIVLSNLDPRAYVLSAFKLSLWRSV